MVKLIKALSIAIMIAAGVTSYHTQRGIFLDWQVDVLTATIAPISIDMLAVICSVAMHLPNVTRAGRVTAVCVLVVAGGGSAAANWMAGSTAGSKAVHVGMVVCYLLAETVASQVRSRAPKDETVTVDVQAEQAAAPDLPDAPVSPAPAHPAVAEFVRKHGRMPHPRHAARLMGKA